MEARGGSWLGSDAGWGSKAEADNTGQKLEGERVAVAAVAVRTCRQAVGCTLPGQEGVEAGVINGTERVSPLGSEVGKSVKVPVEGVGVDKLGVEAVGWTEGAGVEEVSRDV